MAAAAARVAGDAAARSRRRAQVAFVAPALGFYVLFVVGPVLYAVWLSLHETAGYGDSTWVGWQNYARLAGDATFRTALTNTLALLFVAGGVTFALSFLLTLVLREMRGRVFARNVLFFPNIVNAIVFGIVAGFLFNPDGLVNTLLRSLGAQEVPRWLAAENVFTLIIAVLVWSATGYFTTIIMAGVDRIPPHLYEDCELAGAGPLQRLWHVTLPLTWDVFAVCALLWTISSVKIFELILVFGGSTQNMPPTRTWSVAVYSYAEAFGGLGAVPRYGMAAASAMTSLVLVAVIVLLLRKVLERERIEF